MIKVAICDDDEKIISAINSLIRKNISICKIDTYTSGEDLIKNNREYDMIFLDIDMKGINGIDAGREIRKWDKKVYIIYVTNFSDYRKYAFSLHAFGYIEKPINEEEIAEVIADALDYMKDTDKKEKLIEFICEEGIVRVEPSNICYFEYYNRKINMHIKDGIYVLKQKMNIISSSMEEFDFVMPHKSFCVNLSHVKKIKGYDIYMDNNDIVPLSQKKSPYFREKLNIFLENLIG